MRKLQCLTFAIMSILATASAHAGTDTLLWSQTFEDGTVLSGEFGGTLASDQNTFRIDSANNLLLAGAPFSLPFTYLASYATYSNLPNAGTGPYVTLDGSAFDVIFAEKEIGYRTSVVFSSDPSWVSYLGGPAVFAYDDVAGIGWGETTTAGLWQAHTISTAVPEPESYTLLFAGLGVIGVMARRRRQAA